MYKFKSILFGFIIGFIVGACLIWWQKVYIMDVLIDKGFDLVAFFKERTETKDYNEQDAENNRFVDIKKLNYLSNDEKNKPIDAEANADSAIIHIISDSINNDSLSLKTLSDNNFSIQKDEMIYSKSVKIIEKDHHKDIINKADTIFINDNIGEYSLTSDYQVEFWRSPVNFKGYKTGKNKIVLFGVNDIKRLSLKRKNEVLYLQCDNMYYIIENTDNFKPLSVLSNKNIINQLGEN